MPQLFAAVNAVFCRCILARSMLRYT